MEYRRTQWGRMSIPTIIFGSLIVVLLVAADDETSALATAVITAFVVAISSVIVISSRLEVTVTAGRVAATFGFGWPSRAIELRDITAVRQVRNRWWYGFGIRKIPDGWMYNVWGLDAIEIVDSKGKAFRIGTNDPANLLAVLSLLTTK